MIETSLGANTRAFHSLDPLVEVKVVTANKQIIDWLLSLNTNNRAYKRSVVEAYRREIRAKRFLLTNQGIGVDVNNVLTDGQHRLKAIQEEGYPPVQFILVTGLSPDCRLVVDQHAKRNARDAISFAFNTRVSRLAPAIASVIYRERHNWSHTGSIHVHELYDVIAECRDAIDTVVATPKDSRFFAAPYLAGFALIMHQRPTEAKTVCEFIARVESGEMLTKESPAWHLRSLVLGGKAMAGGGGTQFIRFKKTLKATCAYLNNETMGVLRM